MIQSKVLKSLRFVKDQEEIPFDGEYMVIENGCLQSDLNVTIYDGDIEVREAEFPLSDELLYMEMIAMGLRDCQAFPAEAKHRFEKLCIEHERDYSFEKAYLLFTEGESAIEKWWKTFEAQWAKEVQKVKKDLGLLNRFPAYVDNTLVGMTQDEYIAFNKECREKNELSFTTNVDSEEVN